MSTVSSSAEIPVLLLKTASAPHDGYEEYFSVQKRRYQPTFVPVFEHRFREESLKRVWDAIARGQFLYPGAYGGLIFTSQRAVDAFTQIVERFRRDMPGGREYIEGLLPKHLVFYAVGPATARGLRALKLPPNVVGEETGNGDALADYILRDFNTRYMDDVEDGLAKPKLMFLVGEQRRDVIPKKLQVLARDQARITVEEITVYETVEMESFAQDFQAIWSSNKEQGVTTQWIVVFSPTGGKAMLETLGILDEKTSKARSREEIRKLFAHGSRTYIATIGPTTKEYLVREFNFEADVCASKPSPEGVCEGIENFMRRLT